MVWKFCILLKLLSLTEAYRILMVCPRASRSHFILSNMLGRRLVEVGHEVTFVSPFKDEKPLKNYTEIVLTGFVEDKQAKLADFWNLEKISPFAFIQWINFVGKKIVGDIFAHPNFQKLIESDQKFDLIILQNFRTDALNVLQCHFNAPLIIFSIMGPNFWVNPMVGNPSPPSYIPDIFLGYSSPMNFWERLINSGVALVNYISNYVDFLPGQKKLMGQYFPHCTNQDNILTNVSLVLLPSHESYNQPVPLVPNMINIGGFHIKPTKELPEDLKEFMDKAAEGVVYFSMGSNLNTSLINKEIQEDILQALGKLKQKVLYKHNGEMENVPANIKVGKWYPQTDILAHPNTILFITHGGLLSTMETIHHGVPVLALPVFADQKANALKAQVSGYGISIPFFQITEKRLTAALDELINNPKYRENVKMRSILSRDRPVKPMDLAIYWTEYVIKHKGAPHLRVSGLDLSLIQYLLFDVMAFVVLVVICIFLFVYVTCRKICCSKYLLGKSKKE